MAVKLFPSNADIRKTNICIAATLLSFIVKRKPLHLEDIYVYIKLKRHINKL
jgi:hypothetical protein